MTRVSTRIGVSLCAMACLVACDRTPGNGTPAQMRFGKLAADGTPLVARAGAWACVTDRSTGLTWENKSDDEGLHHGTWTYTLHAPSPRGTGQAQGTCNNRLLPQCTAGSFIAAINTVRLCGFDDWRLPSVTELTSIGDRDADPGYMPIHACAFANTEPSSYWTATPDATDRRDVLGINFATLETRAFPPSATLYLRAVRGPAVPATLTSPD